MPGEISLSCSCPDWAVMCKHVAAVLYGVGARLDESPELLFLLRGVDQEELINVQVDATTVETKSSRRRIAEDALGDVFGIEMNETTPPEIPEPAPRPKKKPAHPASGRTDITGKAVARLRARFGMSQAKFAALLGVSTTSVAKWEKTRGRLHLQSRTKEAFNTAKKLTKKAAKLKVDSE